MSKFFNYIWYSKIFKIVLLLFLHWKSPKIWTASKTKDNAGIGVVCVYMLARCLALPQWYSTGSRHLFI